MGVIIPIELGLPTERTILADTNAHLALIEFSLDLANKRRDGAAIWMVAYHQWVMAQYNKRVQSQRFHIRNLIFRRVFENMKEPGYGKLYPNWEGPYRVTHVGPNDTYHLEALDGKALPRPWNVLHLKKFYP